MIPQARIAPALDDVELLSVTVAMEAANQSDRGMLGVAHAIVNRCRAQAQSVPDVVFAAHQFSSWTTGSVTLRWLDTLPPAILWRCRRAAAAAYYELVPDPTHGAEFYLNPELTKKLRGDGTLPPWARDPRDPTKLDDRRVTMREGTHVWMT